MVDPIKTCFGDVREKNWPEPGRIFTVYSNHRSQSIGRGRISREGALDVRESRERRGLLFARVEISVTDFLTKAAKEEEAKEMCLRFFFKS